MKINVSIKAKTSLTVHAFADLLFILYFFPEIREKNVGSAYVNIALD